MMQPREIDSLAAGQPVLDDAQDDGEHRVDDRFGRPANR